MSIPPKSGTDTAQPRASAAAMNAVSPDIVESCNGPDFDGSTQGTRPCCKACDGMHCGAIASVMFWKESSAVGRVVRSVFSTVVTAA
ncbi:hypothetical protein [Nocardia tengchongensis]|uniref:hypothetical protein n=1 Tax=Nocardia tengchongensis TaxID=2055889 RepID=UPI003660C33A